MTGLEKNISFVFRYGFFNFKMDNYFSYYFTNYSVIYFKKTVKSEILNMKTVMECNNKYK